MSEGKEPVVGTTPIGLLRYCNLAERGSYQHKGKMTEPKFSATIVFDKKTQATQEYKALEANVDKLLRHKFGKAKVPSTFTTPIKLCDDRQNTDGSVKAGFDVDGGTWVKFSSKFDIQVYNPMGEIIADKDEIVKGFYPGCYARVVYQMIVSEEGVFAYLAKIQKVKNGERIGGEGAAAGVSFDAVDVGDDDPMA